MQPPSAHDTPLPPITLIGAGRVGSSLAAALTAAGATATTVGRDGLEAACADAEVALLCVPDEELAAAAARIATVTPGPRFIGHTSGATPLSALAGAGVASAFSVHPLQTIPARGTDLTGAPAAVAGTDPGAEELAAAIAERCGMVPFAVPEESRAAYHAAAAIASNFLVALGSSAESLLEAGGIADGRELLAPLVLRTAANWAEHGPAALTGPIARGDEATVAAHIEAIAATAPELEALYRVLAERTREIATAEARR
ncbi:MAG TPA: DUF2520 domain-containing protein [Solirubrobacterales bacterium]|nr:DUF2520 domain-containing protein [Solirubrobacterales bacterium]